VESGEQGVENRDRYVEMERSETVGGGMKTAHTLGQDNVCIFVYPPCKHEKPFLSERMYNISHAKDMSMHEKKYRVSIASD
jgi:hypothetical protein